MDRQDIFEAIGREENWTLVESAYNIRYVCKPLPGYRCPDNTWTRILTTSEEYPYLITDSIGGFELLSEKQLFKHFEFADKGGPDRNKLFEGKKDSLYHVKQEKVITDFEQLENDFYESDYSEPINEVTIKKRLIYNKVLDWTAVRKNNKPIWAFYLNARKYTDNVRDLKMKFRGTDYILNKDKETSRFKYDFLICDDLLMSPDLSYIIPIKHKAFVSNYDIGEFPEIEYTAPTRSVKPHSLFTEEDRFERTLKEETNIRIQEHKDILKTAPSLTILLRIYVLLTLHYLLDRAEVTTLKQLLFNNMQLQFGELLAGNDSNKLRLSTRGLLSIEIKKIRNGNIADEFLFNAGITQNFELRIIINYKASTGGRKNLGIKEKSAAMLRYLAIVDENKEKFNEIVNVALTRFNKHDILFGESLKEAIEICPDMFNETIVNNNARMEYLITDTYNLLMQQLSEKGSRRWKIF